MAISSASTLMIFGGVLAELRAQAKFVPQNGFMIGLDTICEWLSAWKGDNPMATVEELLAIESK